MILLTLSQNISCENGIPALVVEVSRLIKHQPGLRVNIFHSSLSIHGFVLRSLQARKNDQKHPLSHPPGYPGSHAGQSEAGRECHWLLIATFRDSGS